MNDDRSRASKIHRRLPASELFRPRTLARSIRLVCAGSSLLLGGLAAAAPNGGVVVGGSGSISNPNVATTVITQNSQRLALDWQSFDIGAAETVRFEQPAATATALNRILGQSATAIFGRLEANGRVVLANPNGVLFGRGAEVHVNSIVAAGLAADVGSFMAGTLQLQALAGSVGTVVNYGSIEAATGGDVVLAGRAVANHGLIVAQRGQGTLAAGDLATVDFDGDGLLQFAIDEAVDENLSASAAALVNDGVIEADGGQVVMTAHAARDVFSRIVVNNGTVTAGRIDNAGGVIRLVAIGDGGTAENTGVLDASSHGAEDGGAIFVAAEMIDNSGAVHADAELGDGGLVRLESSDTTLHHGTTTAASAGAHGGSVMLLGNRVGLTGAAAVDVSGSSGGGEALIGGDFQGKNPAITNAQETYIGRDVAIRANAGQVGDGGKVIVWADGATRYHGDISATGGSEAGDGGNVEVSGKQNLAFDGTVDASAPHGANGQLLLDPDDLYIRDTGAGAPGVAPMAPELTMNPFDAIPTMDEFFVERGTIEAIAAGTMLTFSAANDIIFDIAGMGLTLQQNGTDTVTFTAGNDILMNGEDLTSMGAPITLNAVNNITDIGTINLAGGTLIVNVGNAATQNIGDMIINGTSLTKQGVGTLTLLAGNTYIGATAIDGGVLRVSADSGLGVAPVMAAPGHLTFNGGTLEATSTFTLNANRGVQLTGAGTFDVDGMTTLTYNGDVAGGGPLTKTDAGTLVLGGMNNYPGATAIEGGTLQLGSGTAIGDSSAVTLNNNAMLDLNGNNETVGSIESTLGTMSILLGGNTLTVGGNNTDTTYRGNIVGMLGGLTKTGSGVLTLASATDYMGMTRVNNGTLKLGNVASVSDTVVMDKILGATATLDLNDLTVTLVSLTVGADTTGTARVLNNGAGTATLQLDTNAAGFTWAGDLQDGTGSLALTKQNANTLTLSGVNTYSGATAIDGGTLRSGSGTAIGDSSAVTLNNNAVLDLNGNNETVGSIASASAMTSIALGAGTLTAGGNNGSTSFAGNITGEGGLTKAGTGGLTLSGSNTYSGATAIDGGTLRSGSGTAIGDSSAVTLNNNAVLDLNGNNETVGSIASASAMTSIALGAGTLTAGGNNGSTSFAGNITGTGGLTKAGTGGLTLSGSNTYSGATAIDGGTLRSGSGTAIGDSSAVTLNNNAVLDLNGNNETVGSIASASAMTSIALGAGTLTAGGNNGSTSFVGNITGTGGLTKAGTGGLTLSGSNTYSGATAIDGGTLRSGSGTAIGDSSAVTLNNNAVLDLNGNNETVGSIASASAMTSIALGAGTLTAGGNNGSTSFVGNITGTGGLTKAGTGGLTLSGSNTYSGATTVSTGTLTVSNASALGTPTTGTTVASGATLSVNNVNIGTEALTLNGGTLAGTGAEAVTGGEITLTANSVVSSAGTLTLNGVVSGGFGLEKTDTGTLVLGAANSYFGPTTVSDGILNLGISDALNGSSALIINGSTVDLNGTSNQVAALTGTPGSILRNGVDATSTLIVNVASAYNGALEGNIIFDYSNASGTLVLSELGVTLADKTLTLGAAGGTTLRLAEANQGQIGSTFFTGLDRIVLSANDDIIQSSATFTGTIEVHGDALWLYSNNVALASNITGGSTLSILPLGAVTGILPGLPLNNTAVINTSDIAGLNATHAAFNGPLAIGTWIESGGNTAITQASLRDTFGGVVNTLNVDSNLVHGHDLLLVGKKINFARGSSVDIGSSALLALATGDVISAEPGVSLAAGTAFLATRERIEGAGNITLGRGIAEAGFLEASAVSSLLEFAAGSGTPRTLSQGEVLQRVPHLLSFFVSSTARDAAAAITSFNSGGQSSQNAALQLTRADTIVFESGSLIEGVSLVGKLGTGIALPLEQCEDPTDCAPATAWTPGYRDLYVGRALESALGDPPYLMQRFW